MPLGSFTVCELLLQNITTQTSPGSITGAITHFVDLIQLFYAADMSEVTITKCHLTDFN